MVCSGPSCKSVDKGSRIGGDIKMLATFFCPSTKTSPSAITCYNYYGNSMGVLAVDISVALTVALAVVIAMGLVEV